MKRNKVLRILAAGGLVASILVSASRSVNAQSPAWPKTCALLSKPPSTLIIGEKTDGYPNECLMAPIEWTNCLRVTKPFADNPKMLAEAEKQWKQKCHEALLAEYPDADVTYEEI